MSFSEIYEDIIEGEHQEYDFLEYDTDTIEPNNILELWWFMGHDDNDYCLQHNLNDNTFTLTLDGSTIDFFSDFEQAISEIRRRYI